MEKIKLGENIYNLKKINSNLQLKNEIVKNKIIKLEFNKENIEIKNYKKPLIILALICKNKEIIIKEILESVVSIIDYLIICDVGSTDNSSKIILNFFKEHTISGELYYDDWKGLDINKTLLFDRCYKKGDYILYLDDTNILCGNLKLFFNETKSGKKKYYAIHKNGSNINKVEFLFNANYKWKFCGLLYNKTKCLDLDENNNMNDDNIYNDIDGDGNEDDDLLNQKFYLISKNNEINSININKYYDDALKLREQFFNTLIDDPDNLNSHSIFYIAQSYRDANKFEQSIQYYSLYTKLNNINKEELFESYMNLSRLHIKYNKFPNKIIEYYINAINLFNDRAEPFYELGTYFNKIKNYEDAYNFFINAKEKDFEKVKNKYKLCINENCYNKYIYDELSVCCYYLEKYEEGLFYLVQIIDDKDFISHKERLLTNLNFFEIKIKEKEREKFIII